MKIVTTAPEQNATTTRNKGLTTNHCTITNINTHTTHPNQERTALGKHIHIRDMRTLADVS